MKITHYAAVVALGVSASAFAAGGHDHDHQHAALHGGVVSEVKHVDYELVATPEQIQLHLRDHGKALDVTGAAARLTILSGSDKQQVELKPDGARLAASGSFKLAGAKVVAVVSRPGQAPATVRFALQ